MAVVRDSADRCLECFGQVMKGVAQRLGLSFENCLLLKIVTLILEVFVPKRLEGNGLQVCGRIFLLESIWSGFAFGDREITYVELSQEHSVSFNPIPDRKILTKLGG